MKTKPCTLCFLAALVVTTVGCADPLRCSVNLLPNTPVTSFISSGTSTQQVVRTNVEIWGHENELTLQRGSYVPKLSILGKNNRVVVEPGAAVARVEIAGNGNEFQTAQGMPVVVTQLGNTAHFETGAR